jgi:hypothetical protein
MNRCACGCRQAVVEAHLVQLDNGDWVRQELVGVKCAQCGAAIRLDVAHTVALMHQVIKEKELRWS